MTVFRNLAESFALGFCALLLATVPLRAEKFPTREITLVVNYGAGGPTDIVMRALAAEASKTLKVPIQVINRPGGQGVSGPTYLAAQKPDGYTLGITSFAPMAISPHIIKVSYKIDDFDYIGAFSRFYYGIAVNSASPIKTLDQLIQEAQRRQVTFSASGPPNNLALFRLGKATGANFKHVPYPSGPDSVTAVLGRHVDAVVHGPTEMLRFIQSGRLRMLASASAVRWPELPDIATLQEQGHDITIDSWVGIAGPKGIPAERLRILSEAFKFAATQPAIRKSLSELGTLPAYVSGPQYRKILHDGYAEMATSLMEAGVVKRK